MARAFLALDLNDATRSALVGAQRRLGFWDRFVDEKISAVPAENLHVTLNFLGEVDDGTLVDVCRAAEEVASEIGPIDFVVRGVRAVPSVGQKLRMFWVEVDDSTGQIGLLYTRLASELAALGFDPDHRSYRPHVTLARVKSAQLVDELRGAAAVLANEDFGANRSEQLTVYTSKLTRNGAVYTPAAHASFTG